MKATSRRICTRLLFLLAVISAVFVAEWALAAARWQERPDFAALFAQAGVSGTLVVYDREQDVLYGCGRVRAETRFLPASTFKILNSLIAFETGAVKDAQEVFRYDGRPRAITSWERDMTVGEAIAVSNVPVYQEIARRIGLERMREWLKTVAYGSVAIGNQVDLFWLQGPLTISAVEQTAFLDALTQRRLPFAPRSYALLDSIMPHENVPGGAGEFFFKTGLAGHSAPPTGWVVGWARVRGKAYPFALNLEVKSDVDTAKRLPLVREGLAKFFADRN